MIGTRQEVTALAVKAYDRELDTLERRIAEMGDAAEKMVIGDAVACVFPILLASRWLRPSAETRCLLLLHDDDSGGRARPALPQPDGLKSPGYR